jgi:hypothetical protein
LSVLVGHARGRDFLLLVLAGSYSEPVRRKP